MGWFGTLKAIGQATGVWRSTVISVGCTVGRTVYREAKRSAMIVNVRRPREPLDEQVKAELAPHFPELDLDRIRMRTRARLPANRFNPAGNYYAMTFGYDIYWRDDFDPGDPSDRVKLAHEVMHVEQVRRHGGESNFACAYGAGYVEGDGDVPSRIGRPTAYHRNPFEAEAYNFEDEFSASLRGDSD